VQRVLDLDLDFFLDGVAHFRGFDEDRLDDEEFPTWEIPEVVSFLRDRCGVRDPLPGLAVENHGELFSVWRDAIEAGALVAPFRVTHVDAHADLGLGDTGHRYLLTELLYAEPQDRRHPRTGSDGLGDGTYLAFAIACRWVAEIEYVFPAGGGDDLHPYLMEHFDPFGDTIRLTALTEAQFAPMNTIQFERPDVESREPRVPIHRIPGKDFRANGPFDFVFLARSPAFTPAAADPIFDEIRQLFIAEGTFGSS